MVRRQWWIKCLSLLFVIFVWIVQADAQELELSGKFENCASEESFKLKVSNITGAGIYTSFRIEWGDGEKTDLTEYSASHTYLTKGRFELLFFGKKADGTEDKKVYPVVNDGGTPKLKLQAGGDNRVCKGTEIQLIVFNLPENTELTSYSLDFGDGTIEEFTGAKFSGQSEIYFRHRYDKLYCDFLEEGGDAAGIRAKITATNACGGLREMMEGPYVVAAPVTLQLNLPPKECTGNLIDFRDFTKFEPEDCMEVNLSLDIVGVENGLQLRHRFDQRGDYTIRVKGIREDIECSEGNDTKVLKIIQRVKAVVIPKEGDICEGDVLSLDASGSEGDEKEYTWSVLEGDASAVQWVPDNKAEQVQAKFTKHGTYRLVLQVDNGCSYEEAYVDVVVKKNPEIVEFKPLSAVCPNEPVEMRNYISYDWTWEGNPKKPVWTVTGPEGGVVWKSGDANSEMPVFAFSKPGVYTLSVELAGVGCGDDSKLHASQTIEVYDPEINLEQIQPDITDVCEGSVVTFSGEAQGVIRGQHWTVTKNGVSAQDVVIETVNNALTKITFPTFGKYTVVTEVTGACDWKSKSFDVVVRRAPEITFLDFPDVFCPGWLFYPGSYVNYNPNGNEQVEVKWEVSGPDGVAIEGANTLQPKVSFTEWGEYTFKVTLVNPTGCGPTERLTATKVLKVSNPEQNLDIVPDKTTICAGEQISFENNSVVGVPPQYSWSVTPSDDVVFDDVRNQQSENPLIQFDKSSLYTVTVAVIGVCKTETIPYSIIVQEDPEVTIDAIEPICPGELVLTDEKVHYLWNDDWKVNAEEQRMVKWSLLEKPGNAVHTPVESPQWNEHYPALELKTPGRYVLQAELKSFASCNGTKLIATQEVIVHDPALSIDVKPKQHADLLALGGNEYQFVEGKPLEFINNSSGVGLACHWRVDSPEDCTISDENAYQPVITFTNHGTYTVTVDLIGTCNAAQRKFVFVVKGVPRFNLKQPENRCDNWAEIDMRDYLTCDSAGSKQIFCNWEIVPDVGYQLTEGTLNDMFFKIKFNKNNTYTLTLKAVAEYGGEQVKSTHVNVLSSVLTVGAELSATEGCTDDGLQVVAVNKSVVDSATYEWRVDPLEGAATTATPEQLTVDFTKAGDYKIYLKARNICDEKEVEYPVRAFSKPEITLLGDTDLGTVCENGYMFLGSEHVGEIKVNNDELESVQWTVSPVGGTWENGTGGGSLRPDLSFDGGKEYVITGAFKNGCSETVTVSYQLAVDEFVPVSLMPDTTVCALTEPFLLRAQPHGGVWSSSDPLTLHEREGKAFYFDPYEDEYHVYELKYERGNGECLAEASITVTVNELPVVNAGEDLQACLNNEPLKLAGIQPVAGDWKGTGVKDGWFDPGKNGAGIFRLEYWFTDAATGCPNLDTINVTVFGLPDTAFDLSETLCSGIDSVFVPVALGKGHTFFWDFGNGDTRQVVDAPVEYQYPVHGHDSVQLIVTSSAAMGGCSDTSGWHYVTVLDPPPTADFVLPERPEYCGPYTTTPIIDPAHFAGDFYHLNYFWSFGNGNSSTDLQPSEQTFQPVVNDTIYEITFRVNNVCGEQVHVDTLQVWSKAVADFFQFEKRQCTPDTVVFVNESTGGPRNEYTWTFDALGSSSAIDTTVVFTTGNQLSVYAIKLEAWNVCNGEQASVHYDTVRVRPNRIYPAFGYGDKSKYICAGDTLCFVNHTVDRDTGALSWSWNFGDGAVSLDWDPCHLFPNPGKYPILFRADNGCAANEAADTVYVHAQPQLTLHSDTPALCEDLEMSFHFETDVPLKQILWDFADGTQVKEGGNSNVHAFEEPGMYEVKVRGYGDQIPSCPGEAIRTVEIWSNPRVKIEPLDTMDCPPLLYHPVVTATSYDYFTWDYGDGSPQTSEMEHVYTNDTNFIQGYRVTAYVENNHGCKEEHHGLVRVYNGPKAAIDKDISYGRPEKVRFINLSRDYTDCYWYLPFGSVVNSPEDQTVTFNDEGVYPVSLAVVNQYGCRDSLYLEHRSYEGGLYFPNSFIPHSTNPKVNRFNGIGMGLKIYKLEIFDMYGNKVWQTTALEGGMPSEGWDGRNQKGELLQQGVYMWRAEAVFFSEDVWTGKNNRSGKPQTTQGSVLLIRK